MVQISHFLYFYIAFFLEGGVGVDYGCEIWCLTLRNKHGLRTYENSVLGRIFGLKRDEVTGEWRRLRNEELCAVYLAFG